MFLPSFAAGIRIREIAKLHNGKKTMSFSDRLYEILKKPIDLLFCNRNEAFSWSQTGNIEIPIDKLKIIARTFVITLGAEDALAYDGIQLYNIEPHKLHAIDTIMEQMIFLFGITHGQDYLTAGNLASLLAATVVSNYGPRLFVAKQKTAISTME
ncbi:unnamed protein product [Rotaria sp. Silwood2]|nr:unnamed protein product [Rotaria sp. Silwood2]CAF2966326.1 unnamed protein product [Rotaria sp. Silwood2]CAF3297384.1 unnamed protein product [Rotaria sp. Silwood2]CAF3350059.1 unnamed protein product [Rotaria sp. Silwood2]CAF4126662.1 unnamed protein product [Rotaria sp. Silwood2]